MGNGNWEEEEGSFYGKGKAEVRDAPCCVFLDVRESSFPKCVAPSLPGGIALYIYHVSGA